MNESELIDKIAAAVADRIGSSEDLWGMGRVAKYLDRNVQTVRNRIACLPSFPRKWRLSCNQFNLSLTPSHQPTQHPPAALCPLPEFSWHQIPIARINSLA